MSSFFQTIQAAFTDLVNNDDRVINQVRSEFLGNYQLWGKKEAVWIDMSNKFQLYIQIPELRAVIDKRASMMMTNKPVMKDKDGNVVEKHWLIDLIKNPNATQSWQDVIFTLAVQDGIYSNAFAYSPKLSFDVRKIIVPLPTDHVIIDTNGKRLNAMDIDGLIDKYRFRYDDGKVENVAIEDMLYIMTSDGINIINPKSRLEGLQLPLSNIMASYKKRNVLLENLSSPGVLSGGKTDIGGAIPLTVEERHELQRSFIKRHKNEIIVTETPVTWSPMSFPTKDLMLFEEVKEDFLKVIDAYGLNMNIFSSTEGSTFSNVRDSIRMVYTDTIIPETETLYQSIISFYGLDKEGYSLHADFSHLPVLQTDESVKNSADKTKVESWTLMLSNGIVSKEQFAMEFGIELMPVDRATAQQNGLIQAQTQLRGTVGGLDGIISLNASVSRGEMTRETAVSTLINYYGYSPEIANQMITA